VTPPEALAKDLWPKRAVSWLRIADKYLTWCALAFIVGVYLQVLEAMLRVAGEERGGCSIAVVHMEKKEELSKS